MDVYYEYHKRKMTQINIRLDDDTDDIIEYIASRRKVPKAVVARELLVENLSNKYLDILLNDYKEGKIGLKRLITLSKHSPREVMQKIAIMGIEPPISADVDDYTQKVADEVIVRMQKEKGNKGHEKNIEQNTIQGARN